MLALYSPIQLSHFTGWFALALFVALAIPVVLLGRSSMAGLGPARKWTAITLRLLLLLVLILVLGGIQWTRRATDVHVVVLRDISESTNQVQTFPGPTLDESVSDYLRTASKAGKETAKKPGDRIGVISFADRAYVDSVADPELRLDARAVRERGSGTDVAAAIQLGLATLQKDTLQRVVLLWDGNATTGDLEAALNAASAARVPIDVMPLKYDVRNEVLVDRFVAPTRKRENEPFTLEVYLTSTNPRETTGRLTVTHQGGPMDLDPNTAGVQASRAVTLKPGQNVERIPVPPLADAGVHQFRSVFEADDPTQQGGVNLGGSAGAGGVAAAKNKTDTLTANNAASAFTFVSGRGKVLYIDNTGQAAATCSARRCSARASNSTTPARGSISSPRAPSSYRTTTRSSSPTSPAAPAGSPTSRAGPWPVTSTTSAAASSSSAGPTRSGPAGGRGRASKKSCPSTWTCLPSGRSRKARSCW
jgi:hypothetical protein